jgi:hypothetical protein
LRVSRSYLSLAADGAVAGVGSCSSSTSATCFCESVPHISTASCVVPSKDTGTRRPARPATTRALLGMEAVPFSLLYWRTGMPQSENSSGLAALTHLLSCKVRPISLATCSDSSPAIHSMTGAGTKSAFCNTSSTCSLALRLAGAGAGSGAGVGSGVMAGLALPIPSRARSAAILSCVSLLLVAMVTPGV